MVLMAIVIFFYICFKYTFYMKHFLLILLCALSIKTNAQEKITMLNFLQAGAIPQTIDQKGKNISTSGLTFNYINFKEPSFFRMDATWLVRYLVNLSLIHI